MDFRNSRWIHFVRQFNSQLVEGLWLEHPVYLHIIYHTLPSMPLDIV